jgi:hypothetical protein
MRLRFVGFGQLVGPNRHGKRRPNK